MGCGGSHEGQCQQVWVLKESLQVYRGSPRQRTRAGGHNCMALKRPCGRAASAAPLASACGVEQDAVFGMGLKGACCCCCRCGVFVYCMLFKNHRLRPQSTCQLHLGLPGFTDRLKLGDLDACHVLLAGVDLEGGPIHIVKHCVLDAVASSIPATANDACSSTVSCWLSCVWLKPCLGASHACKCSC